MQKIALKPVMPKNTVLRRGHNFNIVENEKNMRKTAFLREKGGLGPYVTDGPGAHLKISDFCWTLVYNLIRPQSYHLKHLWGFKCNSMGFCGCITL